MQQPQGGPFFERNGLLLLPLAEVRGTTEGLARAQPLLASLAADPSLRGVLAALSSSLQGVKYGQMKLGDIQPEMAALAETFEKTVAGQPAFFSWHKFLTGGSADAAETRQVILVQAGMDYSALQPAPSPARQSARSPGPSGSIRRMASACASPDLFRWRMRSSAHWLETPMCS